MKALKTFWKDYWELCKESGKWMKKHWKGYLVYCICVVGIYMIPYLVQEFKDRRNNEADDFKSEGGNE